MQTYTSIRDRPTWVTGDPNGWRGADSSDPTATLRAFGFDIADDGAGNYLLVCFSVDGSYGADTWHETMADAIRSAEQQFGIRADEWGPARED
jgi:hypothetical protein